MEDQKYHVISRIAGGSIAEEMEIEPGDVLLSVNGCRVEDVFDYRFLIREEELLVEIRKAGGEIWELEIEKDEDEDLGLEFENGLMDEYRSCCNRCIFCFIDQMPPGMRKTLYFKDDDARLSFLQGNYITLTNMSEEDLSRVIRYRMEPVNISFHTMNPSLRCRMLHNRFAGEALQKAERLYEAGIVMNGQIVLCRGINDGEELQNSIEKLSRYAPVLQSVSVVPVGLTKYREGLEALEPFGPEDACAVIDLIEGWQQRMFRKHGIRFVHASDEWYLLAGRDLPPEESYDGYPQLENGVGMLRLLTEEVREKLSHMRGDDRIRRVSVATGLLAAPTIRSLAEQIHEKFPGIGIRVYPVRNDFFGPRITVSGLVTGQDLAAQLKGQDLGEALLIPCSMLRQGEDIFLDDISVGDVERDLGVRVLVVDPEGADLVEKIVNGPDPERKNRRRQIYEQTSSGYSGKT